MLTKEGGREHSKHVDRRVAWRVVDDAAAPSRSAVPNRVASRCRLLYRAMLPVLLFIVSEHAGTCFGASASTLEREAMETMRAMFQPFYKKLSDIIFVFVYLTVATLRLKNPFHRLHRLLSRDDEPSPGAFMFRVTFNFAARS
jgi:hypothetical protein